MSLPGHPLFNKTAAHRGACKVLQKQCNLLAYSVARASGGGDKRVRNLGRSLLGILGVSSQLQRLLGIAISPGHEAHTREALIQLQRAITS